MQFTHSKNYINRVEFCCDKMANKVLEHCPTAEPVFIFRIDKALIDCIYKFCPYCGAEIVQEFKGNG